MARADSVRGVSRASAGVSPAVKLPTSVDADARANIRMGLKARFLEVIHPHRGLPRPNTRRLRIHRATLGRTVSDVFGQVPPAPQRMHGGATRIFITEFGTRRCKHVPASPPQSPCTQQESAHVPRVCRLQRVRLNLFELGGASHDLPSGPMATGRDRQLRCALVSSGEAHASGSRANSAARSNGSSVGCSPAAHFSHSRKPQNRTNNITDLWTSARSGASSGTGQNIRHPVEIDRTAEALGNPLRNAASGPGESIGQIARSAR